MIFLFSILSLFNFSDNTDVSHDFEYDLTRIVNEFRENIMDEDICEDLKRDASNLVDEIEDELDEEGKYDSSELSELRELKKSASAIEYYIGSVGGCGMLTPKVEAFERANRMVGGSKTSIYTSGCMKIISVRVDDYVAYLAYNDSRESYTLECQWDSKMESGNVTMGISNNGVRHMWDNRDNPSQRDIKITSLKCTVIPSPSFGFD